MAFVTPTQEGVALRRRRLLIAGPPNTRKTSSLLTLPKPLAILSYPGEKGYDTIPLDDPEVKPFIWQTDEAKTVDSHKIIAEVERVSVELVAGKYGKLAALAGDGLHKYVDYVLDAVTDGAFFAGEEFEPKLYKRAYDQVLAYLDRLVHTTIPVVAFTCWTEYEADRIRKPGEKASDIPSHIYPALPGKLAKQIMGEFSMVLYQTLRKETLTSTEPVAMWQTRPQGEVWGASIKGPAAIVTKIPTFIRADYTELTRLWDNLTQGKDTK